MCIHLIMHGDHAANSLSLSLSLSHTHNMFRSPTLHLEGYSRSRGKAIQRTFMLQPSFASVGLVQCSAAWQADGCGPRRTAWGNSMHGKWAAMRCMGQEMEFVLVLLRCRTRTKRCARMYLQELRALFGGKLSQYRPEILAIALYQYPAISVLSVNRLFSSIRFTRLSAKRATDHATPNRTNQRHVWGGQHRSTSKLVKLLLNKRHTTLFQTDF